MELIYIRKEMERYLFMQFFKLRRKTFVNEKSIFITYEGNATISRKSNLEMYISRELVVSSC